VLIVGGGRIGYRLAKQLEDQSIACKVIEKRASQCDFLAEQLDRTVVLHGDGSDQSLLVEENIHDTDLVVTLTSDEETNILASLLAKRLGAKKTITQINKFSYFSLMSAIGIEQVVSPRLSAINSILQHIRRGKVLSAISIKGRRRGGDGSIGPAHVGHRVQALEKDRLPEGIHGGRHYPQRDHYHPQRRQRHRTDDRIIIFATREAIPGVEKILAVKLEYI
jgi:trk system potassium uptake protein TrkA